MKKLSIIILSGILALCGICWSLMQNDTEILPWVVVIVSSIHFLVVFPLMMERELNKKN